MAGAGREPSVPYRNEHLVSCFSRGVGSSIRRDSSITHQPGLRHRHRHRHSPGRVLGLEVSGECRIDRKHPGKIYSTASFGFKNILREVACPRRHCLAPNALGSH